MKNVLLSIGLVALLGLASCGSDSKTEAPAYTPDALDVADTEKKVMVAEFTATWCGPCGQWGKAAVATVADSLGSKGVKVSFNASANNDILYVRETEGFAAYCGITAFPTQVLNLKEVPGATTVAQVISNLILEGKAEANIKPSAVVGLTFKADSTTPGSYIINTRTRIVKDLPEGKYNVGVYILQDNIVAAQNGNSSTFNHKGVFRKICKNASDGISSTWGTTFATADAKVGAKFEKSFTVADPKLTGAVAWVPANLKAMVVVYQMNASGTAPEKVLNVNVATLSK